MSKRNIVLISIGSILLLVGSVVLYYYVKPDHDAIPVYKKLPDDVFRAYFKVGQVGYLARGTLYCDSLDAIKRYYDYMNARNRGRVFLLLASGDCSYESNDKLYAVLEEVTGMFARVTPDDSDDASSRWMPVLEFVRE